MVDGLHGSWSLYNTTRANDSLELVRSGEVTGLSIGFKALPGGTVRRPTARSSGDRPISTTSCSPTSPPTPTPA